MWTTLSLIRQIHIMMREYGAGFFCIRTSYSIIMQHLNWYFKIQSGGNLQMSFSNVLKESLKR